jgi:hypothetical protein
VCKNFDSIMKDAYKDVLLEVQFLALLCSASAVNAVASVALHMHCVRAEGAASSGCAILYSCSSNSCCCAHTVSCRRSATCLMSVRKSSTVQQLADKVTLVFACGL